MEKHEPYYHETTYTHFPHAYGIALIIIWPWLNRLCLFGILMRNRMVLKVTQQMVWRSTRWEQLASRGWALHFSGVRRTALIDGRLVLIVCSRPCSVESPICYWTDKCMILLQFAEPGLKNGHWRRPNTLTPRRYIRVLKSRYLWKSGICHDILIVHKIRFHQALSIDCKM